MNFPKDICCSKCAVFKKKSLKALGPFGYYTLQTNISGLETKSKH